jgi:hypothetical protein
MWVWDDRVAGYSFYLFVIRPGNKNPWGWLSKSPAILQQEGQVEPTLLSTMLNHELNKTLGSTVITAWINLIQNTCITLFLSKAAR